jgi:hypothetical protein
MILMEMAEYKRKYLCGGDEMRRGDEALYDDDDEYGDEKKYHHQRDAPHHI